MASNKKKKKSQNKGQQPKAAQPAQVAAKQEAPQAKQTAPEPKKKGLFKFKADKPEGKKGSSAKSAKSAKKAKGGKPSVLTRVKNYFKAVKTEMHRVVWPSKKELVNYSVAVIASLVVVGVIIAVLDLVIGEGLLLFAGLRG